MGRLRVFFAACLLLFFWGSLAIAAKVQLVNGKELTGTLVGEDEQSIQLLVGGVTVSLFKSEIVSIIDDKGKVQVVEPTQPVPTPQGTPPEAPSQETARPTVRATSTPTATGPPKPTAPLISLSEASPILPVILPAGKSHLIQTGMLNVRRGPGADFDKITALPQETVVVELGRQDTWLRVRAPDGLTGWVLAKYTAPLLDEIVVCTGENVNYRKGPGVNFAAIRKLGPQEVALLLRRQGDWVQLRTADDTLGWVAANYIARVAEPASLRPEYQLLESGQATVQEQREPVPGTSASAVRLLVLDEDWVIGGRIALVLAAEQADPTLWDSVVQGKDIVDKFSLYGQDSAERIGWGTLLGDRSQAVQRVVLKGYLNDRTWEFHYRLGASATSEFPGFRCFLVGQRGEKRGKVFEF